MDPWTSKLDYKLIWMSIQNRIEIKLGECLNLGGKGEEKLKLSLKLDTQNRQEQN